MRSQSMWHSDEYKRIVEIERALSDLQKALIAAFMMCLTIGVKIEGWRIYMYFWFVAIHGVLRDVPKY